MGTKYIGLKYDASMLDSIRNAPMPLTKEQERFIENEMAKMILVMGEPASAILASSVLSFLIYNSRFSVFCCYYKHLLS